jgi:hypothetical protein
MLFKRLSQRLSSVDTRSSKHLSSSHSCSISPPWEASSCNETLKNAHGGTSSRNRGLVVGSKGY